MKTVIAVLSASLFVAACSSSTEPVATQGEPLPSSTIGVAAVTTTTTTTTTATADDPTECSDQLGQPCCLLTGLQMSCVDTDGSTITIYCRNIVNGVGTWSR